MSKNLNKISGKEFAEFVGQLHAATDMFRYAGFSIAPFITNENNTDFPDADFLVIDRVGIERFYFVKAFEEHFETYKLKVPGFDNEEFLDRRITRDILVNSLCRFCRDNKIMVDIMEIKDKDGIAMIPCFTKYIEGRKVSLAFIDNDKYTVVDASNRWNKDSDKNYEKEILDAMPKKRNKASEIKRNTQARIKAKEITAEKKENKKFLN